MSLTQNQNFQFWKDVLASLKRIPSYRGSVKLSTRDSETVSQVIMLNAMIVYDSVPEAGSRSLSNLKRWCINTKRLDVATLDHIQKEILMALREQEEPSSYDRFKHDLGCDPSIFGAFMAPLRDVLASFLGKPNASDFRHLNQFLSFMTRITLLDFDFETEALEDYYKTEDRLGQLSFNQDVVDELREVVHEWFSDFKLGPIEPSHGPGGVAEIGRDSNYEKNKLLGFDPRLDYLLKDTLIEEYFPDLESTCDKTAKVVFVPKNLSSMRTICMEPATLMYLQQGCWKQIDRYMANHKVLRKIIRLKDQSHNRRLSMLGSLLGRYVTIDLSAASDSVSWELVHRVFAGTDYYKICLLTRSTSVKLPDGNTISPNKFAPMGSTICFPTECILFAAICEVAARRSGDRTRDCYSVYGDDIVIRSHLGTDVVGLLSECGFLVNTSKTYFEGPFRESCGGEYFHGNEVTPIKIPRNFKGSKLTIREPSLYRCVIELCNTLSDFGAKAARAYLISKFWALPRGLRPLFDDGTKGIKSSQPTNFHLKVEYDPDLQCHFAYHGDLMSKPSGEREDTWESYFLWFVQSKQRSSSKVAFKEPEDLNVVRTVAPQLKLSRTKTAIYSSYSCYPPKAELVFDE